MNQGKNVGFNFSQVRCAHKSGDVINFIILACRVSSRLKWYKNYKNRLRLAKVIVKNKMSRFFMVHCVHLYLRCSVAACSRDWFTCSGICRRWWARECWIRPGTRKWQWTSTRRTRSSTERHFNFTRPLWSLGTRSTDTHCGFSVPVWWRVM